MHNPQMVDPEFEINRQIKAITKKTKKTDDDHREIARLEWYGGLYAEDFPGKDGTPQRRISQPTAKVRKCLIEAARIYRMGKQVERAIAFTSVHVPLEYDGPRVIDEVHARLEFTSRLSVGVSGKRVMRVRPQFFPWALTVDGLFIEDAGLNFDDLERITEMAGLAVGIGDNRVNGYGHFTGTVRGEGVQK